LVLALGIATLILPAREQPAQPAVVAGAILDSNSTAPLRGAEITWKSRKAIADSAGRYEIELPPGIREISISAAGHPTVKKTLILRDPASRVRQDVLLPAVSISRTVLALDRGSRVGPHGKDLASDTPADSSISIADEYGNQDRLLSLNVGRTRVHSPVWLSAAAIAYGKEGVLHDRERWKILGVFQFETGSSRIRQIASEIGAQFLARAPRADSLALADQKNIYVMNSASAASPVRRVFTLGANQGFILSVAWGADNRIYFTVDDSVSLDERHYLTRSRIASMKADGSDLQPDWAADFGYSFRYPMRGEGDEIVYCRFELDGKRQALWSRNTRTGAVRPVAEPALRAVHIDLSAGRLYYIYRQDLRLRDMKTGADWVILNSVKEADYLSAAQ
jgi:hypothetical protein